MCCVFPTLTCWVFVFSSVSAPRPPPPSRPPSSSHTHTHSLTLTHSLTHSLTLTHTHSLTHSHSLTHTLTHSLSLTHHSLTHSLTHTHKLLSGHEHRTQRVRNPAVSSCPRRSTVLCHLVAFVVAAWCGNRCCRSCDYFSAIDFTILCYFDFTILADLRGWLPVTGGWGGLP